MFRVDKLNYFDKFHCIMGKCPENCCETDWNILVDDGTYGKYQACEEESVRNFISQEMPHRIIKKDHRCPFFRTDGLCTLHKEYGEEFLCETCKNYPRFTSVYGDLYIVSLALSCPAVLDILWKEEKTEIQTQIYYESREELGKQIEFSPDVKFRIRLREDLLRIVQRRELSLGERVTLLLKYSKAVDNGKESSSKGSREELTANSRADDIAMVRWLLEFVRKNCLNNERIRGQEEKIFADNEIDGYRNYLAELENAYPEYRKFFEHILFYSIFEQVMKEKWDVAGSDWLQIICLCLAAIQYWLLCLYKAKRTLTKEDCNIAVYSIMRVLDHSDEVKENFWKEWKQTGFGIPKILW